MSIDYFISFNFIFQPAKKRSKTCILVKNLPAGTDKEEIKLLFVKYGQLARFLMPKHGITALVDFIEPFEAKKAFTKLAYSQFKSAPLYLEWAPENVFVKAIDKPQERTESIAEEVLENNNKENKIETTQDKETSNAITESNEANKVKEPNVEEELPENDTTLFVKNLNFKTSEESLKEVSSNLNWIKFYA